MQIVPNHHVIVPKVYDITGEMPVVTTDVRTRRQAHIQREVLNNDYQVQLNFVPLSDQWIELYLDDYRIVNPKYATIATPGVRYDEYNLDANYVIKFLNPQTGNLKIICDTLSHTDAESYINYQPAGIYILFDNLQSHDVFQKHFTPSRYPMPNLGLSHTAIQVRVGDAHYCEPVVLTQPCFGYVRLTKDRKNLIYVPRPTFKGYDVFGYTMISQHGQMGLPASCTIKVAGKEEYYNYSASFTGNASYLSIRDHKHSFISSLATKKVTIEFYFYTKSVEDSKNFKVGLFGQYRNNLTDGRYGVYLQGTSTTSDQVVVLQFCISSLNNLGNVVYANYKISSKARLQQKRWHHVVIEVDATNPSHTNVKMYLNGYGEFFYNLDFTAQNSHNGDYFLIGAVNDQGNSQTLNGFVSNFRFLINDFVYGNISLERIEIPRRTLANTGNTVVLGITNSISDPYSIQDMSDITRLQKIGNVQVTTFGPFSPFVIQSSGREFMHGDTVRITSNADYVCRDTIFNFEINANVSVGTINSVYFSSNAPTLTHSTINQIGQAVTTTLSNIGYFIVDDIDTLTITIDTHSKMMTSLRKVDVFLKEYPLVIETFDVLADPNGLVLEIQATNDGFAREIVNFNHGNLVSLGSFVSSLGGYFEFNGSTDVIRGRNSKAIDLIKDITCEVWFRIQTANFVSNTVGLLGKGIDGNISYDISYSTMNNTINYFRNRIYSNVNMVYSHTSSLLSSWFQVVCTTQGRKHKIFINGVKEVEEDDLEPDTVISNDMGYRLGTRDYLDFHAGQISIIRIYNRALSDSEVSDNFNQFRSRYGL